MSWLRKNSEPFEDEMPLDAEPAPPPPPYVPASMRPRPDPAQAALEPDDPEADDAQVRFLASLAERVAADASAHGGPAGANATSRQRRVDDDAMLSVFSDSAPDSDRFEGLRKHHIAEVEIADLIDELATTAAALRRRRAA